jgi:Protein of unknown function (DUF1682)
MISVIVMIHVWGTKKNRAIAKKWSESRTPLLKEEFALVGFGGPRRPTAEQVAELGAAAFAGSKELSNPNDVLKEVSPNEFRLYASGRNNIAYVESKLQLHKRYSPLMWIAESLGSFFIESLPAPTEQDITTLSPFDGRESALFSGADGKDAKAASGYDDFVWAIVHKDIMKGLRDERYDISLTTTKDNPKLPIWATVMTESAEITDTLLSPEIIKAVEEAGDHFGYLIITDQPVDKPLR